MNLSEFYKSTGENSDKGIVHCYIDEWYSNEFTPIRNEELSILEIGVNKGDSIILWRDWFINSKIFGIDNKGEMTDEDINIVNNIENVNIIYGDAYSDDIVDLYTNETFDYIIDDGPHTLESQLNWPIINFQLSPGNDNFFKACYSPFFTMDVQTFYKFLHNILILCHFLLPIKKYVLNHGAMEL